MTKVPEDEITVYRLFYNNDEGERVQKFDIGFESMKLVSSLVETNPYTKIVNPDGTVTMTPISHCNIIFEE